MSDDRPKYVHEFDDRHGQVRRYFRRPGFESVALPGTLIDSADFTEAYQAALAGEKPRVQSAPIALETVNAAVEDFYKSSGFKKLRPNTQRLLKSELERFRFGAGERKGSGRRTPKCVGYGEYPVRLLKWEHIDAIVATKMDRPGAAHNFLRTMKKFVKYCLKKKLLTENPTLDIELPPLDPNGLQTWMEEDIALYEEAHKIGTRERLALALPLYTALRREDLILVGRQHIRDGILYVCPRKTKNSTGVTLAIPIHPELARVLEASPSGHLTFLTTKWGRPFAPACFTAWFGGACEAAGLPKGLSVHGLRKASCRRLAEAGCSPHQIMAISGHRTLKEVERYTRAAEQARMARSAMSNQLKDRLCHHDDFWTVAAIMIKR